MTSDITWPYIRMISLKVIKSLQGKESHTNIQTLDQDIKFTPRRTWPPWSNDVICPTGWPCGRMLWSAHIPLANEQGLWIGLSYANFIWRHWIYKMSAWYNLSSVWVRLSIFSHLSIIQYVGLCVLSLPIPFSCDDWDNIYTLCYYHHQIGSMNYYHCIGLGHETMVYVVCLSIFLSEFTSSNYYQRIQISWKPLRLAILNNWIQVHVSNMTWFTTIFQ